MKDLSVLIVEDSETLSADLDKIYTGFGFDTFIAEDGQVAWLYLKNMKTKGKLPELISSDVNMPNMNGIELLTKVRADKDMSQIPFMIFTANKDELFKVTALCLDVSGYQLKPIDADKLKTDLIKIFPNNKIS